MVLEPHMELRLPQALPNQSVFSNPFAAAAPASGLWPWRRAGSHNWTARHRNSILGIGATRLWQLPPGSPQKWTSIFTGVTGNEPTISEILRDFPVALLEGS